MDTMTYAVLAAIPWSVAESNWHLAVPEPELKGVSATEKMPSSAFRKIEYDKVASANFLRRNLSAPTPTNNIVWNFIVSNSGTTYNLTGPFVGQESTAFGGRGLNFFTGTDNIFGNQGDSNGNNNNIQRADSIFSVSGITVNNTLAFAVFERGPTNGHDGFKIAAITGLDSNGNPSSYGPLISLATGKWGTTSLGPLNTLVTRNNANQPGADATHPSAIASGQFLGCVSLNVIQDLGVPAGAKIFGYSLFAADIPAMQTS